MKRYRDEMTLDGAWSVNFDDGNVGRELHWERAEQFYAWPESEQVAVPACLEEYRLDYQGVAWYGRRFAAPAEWAGRPVLLQFDAVNYRAEVWLNGEPVGAHDGGYTGFALEVGDLLRAGADNFLAVRVITPLITRDVRIDGLGRDEMPHWRGAIAGGIWQPVRLAATGPLRVAELTVTAEPRSGAVEAAVEWENTTTRGMRAEVRLAVYAGAAAGAAATAEHTLEAAPGRGTLAARLRVPGPALWDLEQPNLYRLQVEVLAGGVGSDLAERRFGFREFTARDGRFYLNDRPLVLKTVFNEALYPHSLAYPRDLALLDREFALAKAAHVNMIRPWRKPQPPVVYDRADELGMLMVGPLPVECMDHWPRLTPHTAARLLAEVTEMVRRDRHHPSIVIWEMFNEIRRYGLKRLRHRVSLQARELDPTRLIIDEAGGFSGQCSIYLPHRREPQAINDVHMYPGAPLARARYDELLALGKTERQLAAAGLRLGRYTASHVVPGLLTNISELGYGSLPDLEANRRRFAREGNPRCPDYRFHERLLRSFRNVLRESPAAPLFPGVTEFAAAGQRVHYQAQKLMTEAARINPQVAGIGIHAFSDGDWVVGAGVIDLFREPKQAYFALQEVFAPRYLAIRPARHALLVGEELGLRITGVNDGAATAGRLRVTVTDGEGTLLGERELACTLGAAIGDLLEWRLNLAGAPGRCLIRAAFDAAGPGAAAALTNETSVYLLDADGQRLPPQAPALVVETGPLADYLNANHAPGAGPTPFRPELDRAAPAVVDLADAAQTPPERFARLADWVAGGGCAVVLGPPPESWLEPVEHLGLLMSRLPAGRALPFELVLFPALGTWVPCSHVVARHPCFAGLPAGGLMEQEYQNVLPRWCIAAPKSRWIGGNVTCGWYRGQKHKQNFQGLSAAFDGAELTELAHGRGRYLLCQYQIVPHLAGDPVAARLLANLLSWAGSRRPAD